MFCKWIPVLISGFCFSIASQTEAQDDASRPRKAGDRIPIERPPVDEPDWLISPESEGVAITRLPDEEIDARAWSSVQPFDVDGADEFDGSPDTPALEFMRLPPNMPTRVVHAGPDGEVAAAAAGPPGKLVYSNMLGRDAFYWPANYLVSDDITTLTPGGCTLKGYRFQVVGKADPTREGGSYFIEYGLYDNCPQAGGTPIPGTRGTLFVFDDEPVIEVHFAPPPETPVIIPSTVWLGIKPSRNNAGVIAGAPARVGFSNDAAGFPTVGCNATAGGFSPFPHASFNAELFVDESCADVYPGYLNRQPGGNGFNTGVNRCFADDIELNEPNCKLVGYEVGVRLSLPTPSSIFRFRLFRDAGGLPGEEILGTRKVAQVTAGLGSYRLRFSFNPTIPLNTNRVWMSFESTNIGAVWIVTRADATIGNTASTFARSRDGRQCASMVTSPDWVSSQLSPPTTFGGFDVQLFCEGTPPLGACCDMYLTDDGECDPMTHRCVGGEYDGDACYVTLDCKGDPKCTNVPEMNCSFPLNSDLESRPRWQPGNFCQECTYGPDKGKPCATRADCLDSFCEENSPFGVDTPCGVAACCVPGKDQCLNLTEKECTRLPPAYGVNDRQWQIGRYCSEGSQLCPARACLSRQGPCDVAHHSYCDGGPFAEHPCDTGADCVWPCAKVCVGSHDGQLCESNLDCGTNGRCRRQCLGGPFEGELCSQWDDCSPDGMCESRQAAICDGGINDGEPCNEFRDCPLGTCSLMECVGGPRAGRDCGRNFDCRSGICRGQPGCENPLCCLTVCESDPELIGAGCCSTNWTQDCADLAFKLNNFDTCFLTNQPANRECPYADELYPEKPSLISTVPTFRRSGDPKVLCCEKHIGATAYRWLFWYTFVATTGSAQISACKDDDSDADPLIHVFVPENPVNPHRACESLRSIACNDDSGHCGHAGDASVCVTDLKIGARYYVAVAIHSSTGSPNAMTLSLEPGCDVPTRGCEEERPDKQSARQKSD